MAIVKMKKFTLLAFESQKQALLKELQKFEDVHFKNLQQEDLTALSFLNQDISSEAVRYHETESAKIQFCIDKLEPYAEKPKGLKALTTPGKTLDFETFDHFLETYDYESVYTRLKEEDGKITAARSEMTRLAAENETLRAWRKMDAAPAELARLRFVRHLFGSVSKINAETFRVQAEEQFGDVYIEFLGEIKDDAIVLIVAPTGLFDEAFAFFRTLGFSKLTVGFQGVPAAMITANEAAAAALEATVAASKEQMRGLKEEYDRLLIAADYFETLLEREKVCQNFLKSQAVVVIKGWVPADDAAAFRAIVARICREDYYLEEEDVEKDSEDVPIKLKNNRVVSVFEDITVMFSLPRYNEIDPTPFLMPFYLLFFGFMMGDAGYGLLMMLATGVALRVCHFKQGTRKFIQFFFYLGIATVFAGLVYGSFFGFTVFKPILGENGEYKAILATDTDVLTMMILSVAIGVVQVLYGIALKGYMLLRDGKVLAAVFDSLSWIVTLLSCIGLMLGAAGVAPAAVSTVSGWALLASLIVLAATQGRESPTLGGKIGSGLYAVYGLSGYVGDLVSYTRLAALALSGAYIAYSFNLMAGLIPNGPLLITGATAETSLGLVRLIIGGAIMIVGQALNIALSALGAYVHTCRLQYVEFFGKFYEGGGIPFTAFQLKNKYVTIKK